MDTQHVLFLCTGNSARSQMAEAFLRTHGGKRYEAYSAGLEPKGLNPFTVQVMKEIGINVADQTSKGVELYMGRMEFAYVITVCDDADRNCPAVWPGAKQRLHWSFQDPAAVEGSEAEKLAKFREVRDQIEARIKAWVTEQG
jgi:arsenate reductase